MLQSNVPVNPEAVSVDKPQLLRTLKVTADGKGLGDTIPLAPGLLHPLPDIWVTVYVPPVPTVIDAVVILLLHNKVPVKFPAVKVELPQLFTNETVGVTGIVFGVAVALVVALVHPLAVVCLTVYEPPVITVIAVVVAELLHNNVPVKLPAVRTEFPQLSAIEIDGAVGIVFGVAIPLPAKLTHPLLNDV